MPHDAKTNNKPRNKPLKTRVKDAKRSTLFPKTLSYALELPLENVLKRNGFGNHNIAKEWVNIVGKDLAAKCIPLKLEKPSKTRAQGRIHIKASGANAMEVQYQEPKILENLATYYGFPIASEIKIIQ